MLIRQRVLSLEVRPLVGTYGFGLDLGCSRWRVDAANASSGCGRKASLSIQSAGGWHPRADVGVPRTASRPPSWRALLDVWLTEVLPATVGEDLADAWSGAPPHVNPGPMSHEPPGL
jgi:hypothetical protein